VRVFAARLSVSKQCRKRYAVVVNLFIKYLLSNRAWGSGCYHIYAKLIRVKISGTRAAIFNPVAMTSGLFGLEVFLSPQPLLKQQTQHASPSSQYFWFAISQFL
jgi:hypothetical protein